MSQQGGTAAQTIPNGYGVAAALTADGWCAAVKLIPDVDAACLAEFGPQSVRFRRGKTAQAWAEALAADPRRLVALLRTGRRTRKTELAAAERIEGPAVAGPQPAVGWSERRAGRWTLRLWLGESPRTLAEDTRAFRSPSVAWAGQRLFVAAARPEESAGRVEVYTEDGRQSLCVPGARPRLAALPTGEVLLVVERTNGADRADLWAHYYEAGRWWGPFEAPAANDLNFAAGVCADAGTGTFYLVHAACPTFGEDERIGLYRELFLRQFDRLGRTFLPVTSAEARIGLPLRAFADASPHNLVPENPRVLIHQGRPAVAFRVFRPIGLKSHGWDVHLVQKDESGWSAPRRLSEHVGQADPDYAVLSDGEDLVCFLPCCDHQPHYTFAERRTNPDSRRPTQRAKNHRVEIVRVGPDRLLDPVLPEPDDLAVVTIPPARYGIAEPPPALPSRPPGLTLIWADLHPHCAYSKCMSASDGQPDEMLRFQRDMLGCDVLTLTDHIEYNSGPEYHHVADRLEAAADGGRLVLYGAEWAKQPAHHTNFFAIDRAVFDRLRALLLECRHLTELFARIKAECPPGSVTAVRHMHGMSDGDFGVLGPRVTETFDPDVEWAMEAMQTRGNNMVTPCPHWPLFPNNFLSAGKEIGLVGGSDHSRGVGTNRYCLTGFWVRERTAAGVFEALRSRRTLAMSNRKIALYPTLGGQPIGSAVQAAGRLVIRCRFASAATVRRLALLRDGELLPWLDVDARAGVADLVDEAPPRGRHWYVVTAETPPGARRTVGLAHASPFFVKIGE